MLSKKLMLGLVGVSIFATSGMAMGSNMWSQYDTNTIITISEGKLYKKDCTTERKIWDGELYQTFNNCESKILIGNVSTDTSALEAKIQQLEDTVYSCTNPTN